ncbi:Tectonin beta-propeller repeat-containing protein 2, partial [Stegodyphus mimosarum]
MSNGDNSTPCTSTSYPIFKEFLLQSNLLERIPARAQKGLSTFDIEFTSLDANGPYLAIGTNIGIVYLFDRK